MNPFVLRGAAMGLALATLLPLPTANAAPAGPMTMNTIPAAATSPAIEIASRRGWHGGPRYMNRGWRGGPRFANRGWRGGPRYSHRGWRGPGWRGPGWNRWGYYNRGPNWGWAYAAPLIAAPFFVAPYAYTSNCGTVSVRRWYNGRRVWVREYRCF